MALKKYKPITPSLRNRQTITHSHLWKGKPFKSLTKGLHKTGGRGNTGHITVNHIGGGHKKKYRIIDFKKEIGTPSSILRIEYDPNRSSHIALIKSNNKHSYILAPEGISVGQTINMNELEIGTVMEIGKLAIGTRIHNIEIRRGEGGKLARSAGSFAEILVKGEKEVKILLSSKKTYMIPNEALVTIGRVSNIEHNQYKAGKAGVNRWKGKRPVVRGEAMNPVDHPHGGSTIGGRNPVSPWGKLTRGKKTVKKEKN